MCFGRRWMLFRDDSDASSPRWNLANTSSTQQHYQTSPTNSTHNNNAQHSGKFQDLVGQASCVACERRVLCLRLVCVFVWNWLWRELLLIQIAQGSHNNVIHPTETNHDAKLANNNKHRQHTYNKQTPPNLAAENTKNFLLKPFAPSARQIPLLPQMAAPA